MWCGGSSASTLCVANDSGHANHAIARYCAALWRFAALTAVRVDCLRPCEYDTKVQARS